MEVASLHRLTYPELSLLLCYAMRLPIYPRNNENHHRSLTSIYQRNLTSLSLSRLSKPIYYRDNSYQFRECFFLANHWTLHSQSVLITEITSEDRSTSLLSRSHLFISTMTAFLFQHFRSFPIFSVLSRRYLPLPRHHPTSSNIVRALLL